MEALMWRASSVVVSYGVIRGQASRTQEREKKEGTSKSCTEKARLGEKSGAGGNGNGRSFTPGPLPLPSARNLIPAPLRFLWFYNAEKKNEEGSSCRGRDGLSGEVGGFVEDRGKELISRHGGESDGGSVSEDLLMSGAVNLGMDTVLSETDSDIREEIQGSEELSKFDNRSPAKRWLQNLLNVNFLKNGPRIDVRRPLTDMPEKDGGSVTLGGNVGSPCSGNGSDPGADTQLQASASVSAGGALDFVGNDCVGCASEICEMCAVDAVASPLSTLEVPHVNVNHDFESFSKFLSEVPLTELKIIVRSSFLSNLAYLIPEIKAGELARDHDLIFVTSSIDIKAKALAQEKADALDKEKATAAAKRSESGSEVKQESYLSPATAYALAAAATSFLKSQKKDVSVAAGESEGADLKPEIVEQSSFNESTSPLNSGSMADFLGCESSPDGTAKELDLASSDMPAFMRPVTSVVSAERETKQEVANNLRSLHTCPCEWFACDEKSGHTRVFSIQGSESFASWQANLLFEPMQFEASDLGVVVHRGIYEAAIGLYEQILPYVHEHQERHGESSKFKFTGHSLGGSLGMLLSLMLNIRGVVKTSALLPVYTFGAPYIMCGGDYLLKKLGLPLTHVQYIIINRDIVPRTFACNYPDHVAEVLKRVNGTFRDHSCLTHQRLLYAPMGQLMVLQPDQRQSSPHPLLPSGSGLYLIRHQSHNEPPVSKGARGGGVSSRAIQVRAAQRAFLNIPHPLEIISDPAAYGSEGTIAKNHDPRKYVQAINSVLRQEMRRWRRVQRERRRQLWWPLVSADSALLYSKGANVGVQKEQGALKAVTSQGMCEPSGLSHFVSDIAAGRATFPVCVSGDVKGRFSRYKSLIASQHIQMGMVLLVTARMFVQEGFAVALAWV